MRNHRPPSRFEVAQPLQEVTSAESESHGAPSVRIADVARSFSCSRDVIAALIKCGDLPAMDISPNRGRPGHRPMWRIRPEDVEAFLASRKSGPETAVPKRRRRQDKKVIDFVN